MRKIVLTLVCFFGLCLFVLISYTLPFMKLWDKISERNLLTFVRTTWQSTKKHTPITFLLLGHGDPSHEGAKLTDTIFLMRFEPELNKLKFISLPRDLWIENIKDKANSIYAYESKKSEQTALGNTREKYEQIFGQKIDFIVTIDFTGIRSIIDALGGVEVNVRESFVDEKFPILGAENATCEEKGNFDCRYEKLVFASGMQIMSGERALKFIRSRYSSSDQGTDFARQSRQFLILESIGEKLVQSVKKFEIKKLDTVYEALNSHTKRDISNDQILDLLVSLDRKMQPMLINLTPSQDFWKWNKDVKFKGIYVLTPQNDQNGAVAKYVNCVFFQEQSPADCMKN